MIKTVLQNKRLLNFFIYGCGQAFNLVSPLLVAPYIISVCGEGGFAKVGVGFSMSLFLILIVDFAFEIKGPKEVSENRDNPLKLQEIANITYFSKFMIFIAVFFCTSLLIYFIPFLRNEKELYFFSISIILAQVCNPTWFLQGVENFRLLSILNIISKAIYMLLVFFLVKHKNDYVFVNLILGCSTLFFNVIGLIYIKYKYKITFVQPSSTEVVGILRADFSLCISQLFLSARQLSPLIITSYFLGYNIGGQYRVIEQITSMFRTFIQVFLRFFYPSVCFKVSKNLQEGFNYWKKYSVFSALLIFIVVAVLYINSTQLLEFFNVSNKNIITLNPIFKISLIIPLLMSMSYPLEQLMFVLNRNKAYVRIIMSVAAATIILSLLTVNSYGILSIVLSLLLSEIVVAALYFKYSYLYLNKQVISANRNA